MTINAAARRIIPKTPESRASPHRRIIKTDL
jgi:hypothetical protein